MELMETVIIGFEMLSLLSLSRMIRFDIKNGKFKLYPFVQLIV